MKPIITGLLASIASLGLLAACSGDNKLTLPTNVTVPADASLPADATLPSITVPTNITLPDGVTIPDSVTIPAGISIPTDFSVPQEAIDLMIKQFEAAGMKVDKDCFTKLLSDDSLRKLVAAGGAPTPEVIQKFFKCITT